MKINIKIIQKKILTINKINKITKAMKIISAINFKKYLSKINDSFLCQRFLLEVFSTLNFLFLNNEFIQPDPLEEKLVNKNNKVLWIVFGSDLGLCGSFNVKVFNLIQKNISPNDDVIVIGRKIFNYFLNKSFSVVQNYLNLNFNLENINKVVDFLISNQTNFKEIKVVYTGYQLNLRINVLIKQLLPIENNLLIKKNEILSQFILEKQPKYIYENTLFIYLKTLLLIWYWNSRTSEEKTRQLAMENASENSEDIIDKLKLKYNQFRQEKITKEILLASQED